MTRITPDFSAVVPDITPSKKEMISIRRVGEKYFVRINSSSLSVILSCPRKSYYSLFRELKAKSESPALTFGKAIHRALEIFYSVPRGERSIPSHFIERSDVMAFGSPPPEEHFLYEAIKGFVDVAQPLAGLPDTDKRSIPNGIWTLQHYFKDYIDDVYEIYCDEAGPFVERSFSYVTHDTEELQIELFGTIDFILQHSVNKSILPGDHKTVSQLGSDFYNRLKPNHQYSAYILGVQEVFGLAIENFMVNGINVKPRPKTERGSAPSFVRQITSRSKEDLEEFKAALRDGVHRFIGWMEREDWPLGNVDTCTMWGGCSFLEVCSAPHKLRENIISAKFISTKEEK